MKPAEPTFSIPTLLMGFWGRRRRIYHNARICSFADMLEVFISDGTSTRNRESKISELFMVSVSENFNRISDSECDFWNPYVCNVNYNLRILGLEHE